MKTIDKVCLRCDWEGETRDRGCPDCGTTLWLPHISGEPKARRWPFAWMVRRRAVPEPSTAAEPEPIARAVIDPTAPQPEKRRAWVPVTVVVVAAVIAVAVVRAGAPEAPPDALAAALGGSIVYAVPDDLDVGWYRLWIWDLTSGTVRQGPRLREPVQLVDMTSVVNNLVGSISADGDGFSIDTLRHLGADDTATSVLRGDFVAWAPGGRLAVAVRKEPGCGPVAFDTYVAANLTTSSDSLDESCMALAGVSATTTHQYIALEGGGPVRIDQVTFMGVDTVAEGFLPVGAAGSDLFVVRATSANDAAIGPALAVLTFAPGPVPQPLPIGTEGNTLASEDHLSSAAGGEDALVLGTYGGTRGIWSVPPVENDRVVPNLIAVTDASNVSASAAGEDAVVVVLDGRVSVIRDGVANVLELPEGAPAPSASVLWIAQVPAS